MYVLLHKTAHIIVYHFNSLLKQIVTYNVILSLGGFLINIITDLQTPYN